MWNDSSIVQVSRGEKKEKKELSWKILLSVERGIKKKKKKKMFFFPEIFNDKNTFAL